MATNADTHARFRPQVETLEDRTLLASAGLFPGLNLGNLLNGLVRADATAAQYDLVVTRGPKQQNVQPGQQLVLEFNVVNNGPNTATAVKLGQVLSRNLTFVGASHPAQSFRVPSFLDRSLLVQAAVSRLGLPQRLANQLLNRFGNVQFGRALVFELGDIPAGQTVTVQVRAQVSQNGGRLVSAAGAVGTGQEPTLLNNAAFIQYRLRVG